MHILITRPIDQATVTASKLMEMGHNCTIEPLIDVEPIAFTPTTEKYAGVLLTSSNAVSAIINQYSLTERKNIPVLTTGSNTAATARKAGFTRVDHVQGSALSLVERVPSWVEQYQLQNNSSLIYPCAEQTAHDIPKLLAAKDIHCFALPVYRTISRTEFSKDTKLLLEMGKIDAVLLYSAKTARTFVDLAGKANFSLPDINLFVLSKEIAQSLPKGFGRGIIYPITPGENELLALLDQ